MISTIPGSPLRRLVPLAAGAILLTACENVSLPAPPPAPEVACTETAVTANGNTIPVAPGGYAAVGNRVVSAASCQTFRFVGVARPVLSYTPQGDRLGDSTLAAEDFAAIRSWRANTVRIELAQYYWVPTARAYDPGYADRVTRVVRQARAAGLNVILVLQASDRGIADYEPVGNTQQPMPDRAHSIPFWRDVASRFKGDGGVLFELHSEPFPLGGPGGFSNWTMWLNGGLHPADDVYGPRPAFQAVGMQELYDVVRGTGAHNMVIIGGTKWGYNLDGVPANRVRGYNIAYATHPWNHPEYPDANQPETWDREWAFLAATDPIIITEFGQFDCRSDYVGKLLDKADAIGAGWIAWVWNAPAPGESMAQGGVNDPICRRSFLITDYAGTPSRTGATIKERLARY